MKWKVFGRIADVVGTASSGISTGMAAKDIISEILDPSAGMDRRFEAIEDDLAQLSRDLDWMRANDNALSLTESVAAARGALSDLGDTSLSHQDEGRIRANADAGLDGVLATVRHMTEFGVGPSIADIGNAGAALMTAVTAQLQATHALDNGKETGETSSVHGGDREHGGHRTDSVRDAVQEAALRLEGMRDRLEEVADIDVDHDSFTMFRDASVKAGDPLHEWWDTRKTSSQDYYDFLSFWGIQSEDTEVTEFVLTADYGIAPSPHEAEDLLSEIVEGIVGTGVADFELDSSADGWELSAMVRHGTDIRIEGPDTLEVVELTHATDYRIARMIEDAFEREIVEGANLAGVDAVIDGWRELVDGKTVTEVDADGVMHGTRFAEDVLLERLMNFGRDTPELNFLSRDGDDFLDNSSTSDSQPRAVEMHGYGGSDYLRGADRVGGHDGDDKMFGGAGADVYYGGSGDDLMRDTGGTDRAVFSGNIDDYTFSRETVDGREVIVVEGDDGRDILDGIEFATFDDYDRKDLSTVPAPAPEPASVHSAPAPAATPWSLPDTFRFNTSFYEPEDMTPAPMPSYSPFVSPVYDDPEPVHSPLHNGLQVPGFAEADWFGA
jgi:hypothetical protein